MRKEEERERVREEEERERVREEEEREGSQPAHCMQVR